MTIPESQLETWSHQGSITQSKNTYSIIKCALEDANAKYADRSFEVFLQGSYVNDTNIFAESDVDVVIRYDGAFFHNINELPDEQQKAFHELFSGNYPYSSFNNPYSAFKGDVQTVLEEAFGRSVKSGKKAIRIEADGSRRNADVVIAFEYRHYDKFISRFDQSFRGPGIAFFDSDNMRIENYPKQHSENCTTKHQATGKNFKPLVRILKNMREKLVADGLIGKDVAPSYFIEGLLYNVPNNNFSGTTYQSIIFNVLNWLHQTTDRTEFVCANEQHYLLRDNEHVCWSTANGEQFIDAAITLWNTW